MPWEEAIMEQTLQRGADEELELVIGELEMELPEASSELKADSCQNIYCGPAYSS